jgi:hypothetical protein
MAQILHLAEPSISLPPGRAALILADKTHKDRELTAQARGLDVPQAKE